MKPQRRGSAPTGSPGYPDEHPAVIEYVGVVMDEEIEHHRFAVRDLAQRETRQSETARTER